MSYRWLCKFHFLHFLPQLIVGKIWKNSQHLVLSRETSVNFSRIFTRKILKEKNCKNVCMQFFVWLHRIIKLQGDYLILYARSQVRIADIGLIPSRLSLLLWHPVTKVEEPEFGLWTARYCAMCHYYRNKPFWKWGNESSAQHWPVAVPKRSVGGQSLGQNWLPSTYWSYHSSNYTILATDLRQQFFQCWKCNITML